MPIHAIKISHYFQIHRKIASPLFLLVQNTRNYFAAYKNPSAMNIVRSIAVALLATFSLTVFLQGSTVNALECDLVQNIDDWVSEIVGFRDDGKIFFFGSRRHRLWVTDGTPNGTFVLMEAPDDYGGETDQFVEAQFLPTTQEVYFFHSAPDQYTSSKGLYLWKSDGTESGTTVVYDFENEPVGNTPEVLSDLIANKERGEVYFEVPGGLWKSDGTHNGTELLKPTLLRWGHANADILTGELNGDLFFSGCFANTSCWEDGEPAGGLWKTDGTTLGTTLVKKLNPYNFLWKHNGKLYFDVSDGRHLYSTDGTSSGTLNLFSEDDQILSINLKYQPCGGDLYILGYYERAGQLSQVVLGKNTDGTPSGTIMYNELDLDIQQMGCLDDVLLMAVRGWPDTELWRWNIQNPDSVPEYVTDIASEGFRDGLGSGIVFEGHLYFPTEYGLWKTNGEAEGTRPVYQRDPDSEKLETADNPQSAAAVANGRYYYSDLHSNDDGSDIDDRSYLWSCIPSDETPVPTEQTDNFFDGSLGDDGNEPGAGDPTSAPANGESNDNGANNRDSPSLSESFAAFSRTSLCILSPLVLSLWQLQHVIE